MIKSYFSKKSHAIVDLREPSQLGEQRWLRLKGLVLVFSLFFSLATWSQVANYSMTPASGTFTPISGGTATSLTNTADDAISTAFNIGFNFVYNGVTYTQVMATSNGALLFGTGRTGSSANNLATTTSTQRPGVAPLWDDLQCTAGVKYLLSGASGSQVLTVEWLNMEWNWNSTTAVISFQVKLYEGTNEIEFVYRQDATAVNTGSSGASIGIMGATSTDFISLTSSSASPGTSTTTSTNTITTKPATGQIYRFSPPVPCSGTPNAGTASVSSSSGCTGGTVTLSATGLTTGVTGVTYNWQSSPDGSTGWTNISGATSASYNATVASGTTYYRIVTTCSNGPTTNNSNSVSVNGITCTSTNVPTTGFNSVACGVNTQLYDNGGAAGSYLASSSGYTVLENSGTGVITLTGTYSGIETCCDNIKIYSGAGTGGTLLATYGSAGSGTITTVVSSPGQAITVQLNSDGSVQGAGFAFQAIYSGTCNSCANPTALSATNITATTADLSWTAPATGSTPVGYEYVLSTSNTAPTGSGTAVTGTSVTGASLASQTTWYLFVRSDCGGGSFSSWSAAYSFNNEMKVPATGNNSYTVCSGNIYDSGGSTGDYVASSTGYTVLNPTAGNLIQITGVSSAGESCCDNIKIYDGAGITGTLLGTIAMGTVPGTFTSTTGSLTIQHNSDSSIQGAGFNISITCIPAPSCIVPTALSATNVTATTADLSWTAPATGSTPVGYEYVLSTSNTAPTGSGTAVTGTSVTGVSLASQSTWYLFVRTDCGGGSFSSWTTAYSFNNIVGNTCALPIIANTFPYTDANTTCGAGNDYGTQCGGSYGGGEDKVYRLDITTTGLYTITVTGASGVTWTGWFLKDAANCATGSSCLTSAVSGSGTTATGTYNFTAAGTYFLIIDHWPSPDCGAYTLSILPPPTCGSITLGTTTAITHNSATLNWTAGTPAPSYYEIEYGVSPYTFTGTPTVTTTSSGLSQVLSSLSASTTYQFKIRSVCPPTDFGFWSATGSFTTAVAPPANDDAAAAIAVACGDTVSGSTTNATNDQPNPAVFGVTADLSKNVWYKFTGTGSPQTVTASLCGSGYDTAILIATGTPGNFTYIAGNDDSETCGSFSTQSLVEFYSNGTSTYYIMVRGYSTTSSGSFSLAISCVAACTPNANDEATGAITVAYNTPLATDNSCTFPSGGVAYPSCGSAFASYYDGWYKFNTGAFYSGAKITVTSTSPAAVGFAVYSGTPGSLTQVTGSCSTTGALTTVSGLATNTTYYIRCFSTSTTTRGSFSISLQPVYAPIPVQIIAADCGITLPLLYSTIGATLPTIPPGTTLTYQFKVKNLATNVERIVDRPIRNFNLSMAADIAQYGTQYSVQVAAVLNGEVQPYVGATCLFSTPSVPTTQLLSTSCGVTLAYNNSTIGCRSVSTANMYRFRVAKASDPTTYYYIDRTLQTFQLTAVPDLVVEAGTAYLVDVQVRVIINATEVWGDYGAVCTVTTPSTAPAKQADDALAKANDAQQSLEAVAYPNPFNSEFSIKLNTESSSPVQIAVYDMLGRQVETQQVAIHNSEILGLGNAYPAGVYTVVLTQDNLATTVRVVKK